MKLWKKVLLGLAAVLAIFVVMILVVFGGSEHQGPGEIHTTPLPAASVEARETAQAKAHKGLVPSGSGARQILFGDFHVHTTFSTDAFLMSLPLLGGEGSRPPADACDFARYCAGLDFFALTDHAEGLTPKHWQDSKESMRQCAAVSGEGDNPDLVPFVGWEWTQVGATPETHYGHKNVIFPDLEDDKLPARPISALGLGNRALRGGGLDAATLMSFAAIPFKEFSRRQRYLDMGRHAREIASVPICPDGVDVRELPNDCKEVAATPRVLFDKLDQWNFDAVVIPHGTTWGFYSPPGSNWDKQIDPAQNDADRQTLIEVYSGHGNSEEYRDWRAVELDKDGKWVCPEPSEGYEPCCWRAGEIIRSRCGDASPEVCESRVEAARAEHVSLGVAGFRAISGTTVHDWQGCGQCLDCFLPSFGYRPGGSAQYILARGHFGADGTVSHMTPGMMASSDNHKARPGTGYKEYARRKMTEATGPATEAWVDLVYGERGEPLPTALDLTAGELVPFRAVYAERQASFFATGGLIAVHSEGRSREAIWEAVKRKEVYGTSGDRILLWFDMLNAPDGRATMGAEVGFGDTPRFEVRAVGAFDQQPGCPAHVSDAIGAEAVDRLCADECYNPSPERHKIVRIEIVRIKRQKSPEEKIGALIEDVWKTLECPPDPAGCKVVFEDPDYKAGARDVVYYARAIQEPTNAVNGGQLRCKGEGCKTVEPCYGGLPTALDDDCLAPVEERAWSSPIAVRFDPTVVPAPPPIVPSDEEAP